ncbi:MAG: hypothetical protein H6807_03990 [Planctomycetes bacterium]|nr:hypothetical protein [Planctomycetota bacterium]
MKRIGSLLGILLLLAASASSQVTLTTPSSSNNSSGGVLFDLSASSYCRITGFDLMLSPGSRTIEVWSVTDGSSWIGKQGSAGAWTLLGKVSVYSTTSLQATQLPLPLDVVLPAGAKTGFYLRTTSGTLSYENGVNMDAASVVTAGLALHEGAGMATFGGSVFGGTTPGGSSRIFRGAIRFSNSSVGSAASLATAASVDDSEDAIEFDVEAKSRDVVVTGLSAMLKPGVYHLQLYVAESNVPAATAGHGFGAWRLIGERYGFVVANAGSQELPFSFEAAVPKGKRRGFYLVTNVEAGIDCQNASGSPLRAVGSDIDIHSGTAYDTASASFGNPVDAGLFAGTVHYRIPSQGTGITPGGSSVFSGTPTVGYFDIGVFFDLKSNKPIVVESIDCNLDAGNHTIEVWALTAGGSQLGAAGTPSLWTRISSEPVSLVTGGSVQVAQDLRLFIPEGGIQGLYVTATNNAINTVFYTQDFNVSGDFKSDGTLTMATGAAGDYPFIPQVSYVQPDVQVHYRRLGRADSGFFEDFSGGSGIQPPSGWISALVEGNRPKLDGWRFDNPGNRTLNQPQSAPIAIFDTDESGTGNFVSGALYSPLFDASGDLDIRLDLDGYFRQYFSSSDAWIEVWDGTVWNEIVHFASSQATDPTHSSYDLTAAAGGYQSAIVRFRYEGNYAWYWKLDNINLQIGQKGQRPQLEIGEFDINNATDALHGQPVKSGLPGPYEATAHILAPTVFHWEGEPNQPIQLLAGFLNLGNVVLDPQGQLDIGSYDPVTMTFPGLLLLADGTAGDLVNASFRTSNAGELTMPLNLPPYAIGLTVHFQSVVFSTTQNIALTNVVTLDIVN